MDKNDPGILIRPADLADLETIVSYNASLALETESLRLDPQTLRVGVRKVLEDPARSLYFMAEVDGVVAGQIMVTFEWSDWRNGYFWWIQSVYVDARFRRRGVFRRLYAHVRDLARSKPDVCGLRLYVHRDNRRAQFTYESLGMESSPYLIREEDWFRPSGESASEA